MFFLILGFIIAIWVYLSGFTLKGNAPDIILVLVALCGMYYGIGKGKGSDKRGQTDTIGVCGLAHPVRCFSDLVTQWDSQGIHWDDTPPITDN